MWIGSPNYTPGRHHPPVALVVHTMSGSLAGTDGWFGNPSAQVSAHFGAGASGQLHQYVDLGNTAWANGILEGGNRWGALLESIGRGDLDGWNPNGVTVSVETEDFGDPNAPVTDAEYQAVLSAGKLALARWPGLSVVTGHEVISPSSRAGCPGHRWTASGRLAALAEALRIGLFV